MYKLFIDTHSNLITISFIRNNETFTKTLESEHGHAEVFLPLFKQMLKEKDIKFNDIEEIIAVYGPGSFTGIRIGLTMAKILSYTKNIPVKLISSLEGYLVSTETKNNKLSYIEDARGAFVLAFDKNNKVMLKEQYLEEYENLLTEYEIVPNKFDIEKIIEYSKNIEYTSVHNIKPNYVKKIEAEK